MTLNENQSRVLAGGIGGIDRNLAALELRLSRDDIDDMSELERRALVDHLRLARRRLHDGLGRLGLRAPKLAAHARGHTSTTLTFAGIHLADLRPKALRGYGELDRETAMKIERFIADASRAVAMAQAVLSSAGPSFETRLARIGGDADAALLASIIDRQGLAELRGTLESLVERLESPMFEVAFFGRVSSGKSSLLNALLGDSILPVGALPVTAVPTRIVKGASDILRVLILGEDRPVEHSLERLADFVTEERNPDNASRVVSVTVALASERLRPDIALVDTPGVGSLAVAGARATYAYLPRCDLGVICVAAGGALEHDDIDLVRRLHDSGIAMRLVVTKADLLSTDERTRFTEYVRARVFAACAEDVPVSLVSTVSPVAGPASAWYGREIEPMLDVAEVTRGRSRDRKLLALRTAVVDALRDRSGAGGDDVPIVDVTGIAGEIEALLEQTEDRCHALAGTVVELTAAVIRRAAQRVVESSGLRAADAVREAVFDSTDEVVQGVRNELVAARDRVRELLSSLPGDEIDVDFMSLPVIAAPELPTIRVRGWRRWIPGRRYRLERTLIEAAAGPTSNAFYRFTAALRQWSRAARQRLSKQAAARIDRLRVASRLPGPASESIERDLRSLSVDHEAEFAAD